MKKRGLLLFIGLVSMVFTAPAFAHFQMLYTPESALERGGEMLFKLIFTHPFDAEHVMNMEPVEEFYVVHQRGSRGEPTKTDLRQYLKEITWAAGGDSGKAYEAVIPASVVRSMGDYVFVLVPGPYYRESKEEYLQLITKVIANVGGVPGNWHQPMGLPAEIVPLNKPYANWTGGTFTGVVMSNGEPVPHAELEIEYLNFDMDMDANAFAGDPKIVAPHPAFATIEARANDRGEFTIGLPKAGWWGIVAEDVVEFERDGKEYVQEAVLWIQVTDIP